MGACVDDDATLAGCAGPHAGQVFTVGAACEPETLREFAGMSDRDVLRPDIDIESLDGGACSFSLRGGTALTGSLEGAFAEARSEVASQLRHCLDGDLNPIGCGVPHVGEVVGVASADQSCRDVAAAFLGWSASTLPAGIGLSTRGQPEECLITVKGANVLTSTLRDIGRRALPIEATS